jgi:hypothetical protein
VAAKLFDFSFAMIMWPVNNRKTPVPDIGPDSQHQRAASSTKESINKILQVVLDGCWDDDPDNDLDGDYTLEDKERNGCHLFAPVDILAVPEYVTQLERSQGDEEISYSAALSALRVKRRHASL